MVGSPPRMPQRTLTAVKKQGPALTATPLAEALSQAQNRPGLDSEFCREGDCHRLFGLKRGTVGNLVLQKKIKAIWLRQEGAKRAVKLIYVPSVRHYLQTLLDEQGN